MLVGFAALLLAFGPPVLPPDGSPGETSPPSDVAPPSDAAPPSETPPADAPLDDEAISITPEAPSETPPTDATPPVDATPPADAPASDATPPSEPARPSVQRPGSKTAPTTTTPVPAPAVAPVNPPAATTPEPTPAAEPTPPGKTDAEAKAEQDAKGKPKEGKKLGGFRVARLGVFAKLGYTNGVSQKNGIFDRNKSIQDSIDNQSPTVSGGGDLGTTRFGGFQGGFGIDAEVVGINAWFDFHKFFRPGGMWSVLLGYDHEFGFGTRYRLDVGVGVGVQKVFLGKALEQLYYDKDNPQAVNIGTLGLEGRAMLDFHIKLVGPLFTGPQAMIGYHYLWSANATEVTAEKGMHFSIGWTLRIDLAAPKLLGGKKRR